MYRVMYSKSAAYLAPYILMVTLAYTRTYMAPGTHALLTYILDTHPSFPGQGHMLLRAAGLPLLFFLFSVSSLPLP
jgi:hypothetical protein